MIYHAALSILIKSRDIISICKPHPHRWGSFYARLTSRDAMSNYDKSHEWVYNEYHKTDNIITKRSYLDILKRRANNGSKDAKKYVDLIEATR